jgi:hypothetical protein
MSAGKKSSSSSAKKAGKNRAVSGNTTPARPKAEWNSYLTDNTYQISAEDVLKKKNMLISKHNMFAGDNERTRSGSTSRRNSDSHTNSGSISAKKAKPKRQSSSGGDETGYDYMLHRPDDELADLTVLDIMEDDEAASEVDDSDADSSIIGGHLRSDPGFGYRNRMTNATSRPKEQTDRGRSGQAVRRVHQCSDDLEEYHRKTQKFAEKSIKNEKMHRNLTCSSSQRGRDDSQYAVHQSSSTGIKAASTATAKLSPTLVHIRQNAKNAHDVSEPSMMAKISMIKDRSNMNSSHSADYLTEVISQIRVLLAEMKDYEFLTNKAKIFDSEVLNCVVLAWI